jgi:hypothetical protein
MLEPFKENLGGGCQGGETSLGSHKVQEGKGEQFTTEKKFSFLQNFEETKEKCTKSLKAKLEHVPANTDVPLPDAMAKAYPSREGLQRNSGSPGLQRRETRASLENPALIAWDSLPTALGHMVVLPGAPGVLGSSLSLGETIRLCAWLKVPCKLGK